MPETTQRAYTLRLQGQNPENASWREALWKTHETVNRGAKAFGDWLLTLRGGLDHSLADDKGVSGQPPTEEQRKQRRILLALSWLTVESENGAPQEYIVPHDRDEISGTRRNWKTIEALREILKNRGCRDDEIESWCHDCKPSLTSAIRKDAVWVNRSKAFDNAVKSIPYFSREEIWDLLHRFFVSQKKYLAPLDSPTEDKPDTTKKNSSKRLIKSARNWLSNRFGTGKGADFERSAAVYEAISRWASEAKPNKTNVLIDDLAKALQKFGVKTRDIKGISNVLKKSGRKSKTRSLLLQLSAKPNIEDKDLQRLKDTAEKDSKKERSKIGVKGHRDYASEILKAVEAACGFTYLQEGDRAKHREFAVMLDHAARRVSSLHTWIKQAEAERRRFEIDTKKKDQLPASVKQWLDTYCQKRSEETGAVEPYRIRRGAIEGWKEIVEAWSKPAITTSEERIQEARRLQDNPEIDKFGDVKLFEDLAREDALPVWHANGDPDKPPDPQLLIDYVETSEAEFKKRAYKVPAYCHPDPFLHPVFCDYGCSRWNISFTIHKEKAPDDPHGLSLDVWDGRAIRSVALRWQSKRFVRDLALNPKRSSDKPKVTRADRFGRALAECPSSDEVCIRGLFEDEDWNGRLQAPRPELTALAKHVAKYGWDEKANKLRNRLNWFITFSAKLRPSGPWEEYTKYAGGKHASPNKRGTMAKLRLSRLPELRVLSVDLGHRYAAACAVWETLSKAAFEQEIRERQILRGGTGPNDLFCHTRHVTDGQAKVTIYRRIGADTLPDGTLHPAPWARLDRQFLIKLPGEEREARKASPTELAQVEKLEKGLGRKTPDNRVKRIDDLMSDTLRTVRLALQRHNRRAQIAFKLTTTKRHLPGGRVESLGEQDRVTLLCETLKMWHSLFMGDDWTDDWAKTLWDEHIVPLLPPFDNQKADDLKWLKPAAEELASNPTKTQELHILWASRWQEDEQLWKERLRWLRHWILPRGIQTSAQKASIRHVGGLSLTRLATIKTLYQVLKAYHMRPEPDNPRKNIPAEGDEALQNFGQKILDDLEHMREQRVKQLASRIVEAALGLGRMKRATNKRDPKRPRERVDQSCHAVVIEDLTHYRPEERQTRRENRQLMNWSANKVKKYLGEGCELHGLHLIKVPASYTSRQDSRTGAPGIRCQEVPLIDFLKEPFWCKKVKCAKQRLSVGKANACDRYLCQLYERWENTPVTKAQTAICLQIPLKGGELFVSADQNSPASKGIQADLNAAANIGLRAITDPDWSGAWWYVPCEANTFKPVKNKVAGSAAIDPNVPLKKDSPNSEKPASGQKHLVQRSRASKSIINLWCDISSKSISERDQWQESVPYWEDVAVRVIKILQASLVCSTTNSQ